MKEIIVNSQEYQKKHMSMCPTMWFKRPVILPCFPPASGRWQLIFQNYPKKYSFSPLR